MTLKGLSARYSLFSLLLLAACTRTPENSIRLITLKEGDKFSVFTYKISETAFNADSSRVSFPAENGDLLFSDDLFLTAAKDLPDTLTLRQENFRYYLNDELYQIKIDTNQELLPWLQQQEGKHLNHVKNLWFNIPPLESHRVYLQQLATMNPGLSVTLNYDTAGITDSDLAWFAQFIKPHVLIMSEGTRNMTSLARANFHDLEYLVIDFSQSNPADVLPSIPSLKALFITVDGPLPGPDFFKQNPQLEKLTIIGGSLATPGAPPWKMLNHLRELNFSVDSVAPYTIARYHPDLQTLIIQRDFNMDSLKGIKNLKWLSLGAPRMVKAMDQIPAVLPSLELLSLINQDSTQDFSPLGKLPRLKYLVISNEVGLDTTLYSFKGLKYLSVPAKFLEDSTRANALRQALPSTVISPNSGLCMGTGWLLLLLPLAVLLFLVRRQKA